jgi:hypothetical protein
MTLTPKTTIDKLTDFQNRDKFSVSAWNERGLNPSSDEMCRQLTYNFNTGADALIKAIENNASHKQLKTIMRSNLAVFNKREYDTEEKEFICSVFEELSWIAGVDFNDDLNKWLYGSALSTLIKFKNIFNPEKIAEELQQPCTNCNIQLKTQIIKKQLGIPETSWFIVKCDNCKELNLLTVGPDVKQLRFVNYKSIDTLSMNEYDYEQALTRLNQIKFFRK